MVIAGVCLVVITLIIPWGVFTRYVLNSASSWPEPAAVLLMIWFSFLAAALCYRENLHIGVAVIPMMLQGNAQHRRRLADRALHDGHQPLHALVGHQARPDHLVPVDRRLPLVFGRRCPICRCRSAAPSPSLFVIERLWTSAISSPSPADDSLSRRQRPSRRDAPWTCFILIGGFTVLCLLGMPVAYALGLAAIFTALWIDLPLEAVMLKTSDGMDDFALLAIPFFILAGGIMAEGGMAERLVNLAKIFVGFIRGGLALVNILASTFFGCISGSSVADTASIGSVMIPQMIKNGYPRLFAVNVTIAGSLQPLLIPPSHNAVIYSLAAGGTISVAHLFIAGIIPGLLLGLSLMVALLLIIAHRRQLPEGRGHPAAPRAQDRRRGVLGPAHRLHHHRRHPERHLHAHRVGRGRLHLLVPRHDVHLSRLQVARAAAADRRASCAPSAWS